MSELFLQFVDLVLHLDVHLAVIASQMGVWLYLILFLIIFAETGLVIMPFLPGDSLLFAVGALAALPGSDLSIGALYFLLIAAAILGDNCNYTIGAWIGPRIFDRPKSLLLNPEHLRRTQRFYEEHGRKTVFFARFLPLLRTFAPFVAGVGHMDRKVFFGYSAGGSVTWMTVFLGAGYAFGNIEWVKRNFSVLIMAVIVVSFLPAAFTLIRAKLRAA